MQWCLVLGKTLQGLQGGWLSQVRSAALHAAQIAGHHQELLQESLYYAGSGGNVL